MLMVSLLAMSVTVAGAQITRPPCSAQIRADDMCYAAALPDARSETSKKSGICFVCLAPPQDDAKAVRPQSRLKMAFGAAVPSDARRLAPWRPPQA